MKQENSPIYFITSNHSKFASLQKLLQPLGVDLRQLDYDFDGEKDHIFVANEEGFIVDEPRGDSLHGWTELLYIYGHPSFPGRSLAELNDEEWQEYLTIIEKVDGLAMLRDYLIDA